MGRSCFACGGSGGSLWAGGGGEVGAVCLDELGYDWETWSVAYKQADGDYVWGYVWEGAGSLEGVSLGGSWRILLGGSLDGGLDDLKTNSGGSLGTLDGKSGYWSFGA